MLATTPGIRTNETTAADDDLQEVFIAELRAAANAHPKFANNPVIITFPACHGPISKAAVE